MARTNAKGFKELQSKLKLMETKTRDKAALRATATMARVIRDEAKARVYTAPKEWRVYYGPKGGGRVKKTHTPGSVADVIIMKRIPPSERKGYLSKHLVTIKKGSEPELERAALMMEFGGNSNDAQFKPFMRPSLRSKRQAAIQEAQVVVAEELMKAWHT